MNSDEMKELASLVKKHDIFTDLTIEDVKELVHRTKQHLASNI